jgi:hypothetical protein
MTRAEAMNRHPAKGTDSIDKLLILLELTKLSKELQAEADAAGNKDLAYHCLKQGMANGIDYAIKTIQAMKSVTE